MLVVSVDGLDWRYLRDADRLGLKIPVIRGLMRQGRYAQGVVGVYPTVTWPSHTSMITGVRPDQHGILGNRRPKSEGGEYYWYAKFLKVPTLWQAAHEHGLITASVTWPVTADAAIDFDLPEFFARRNGGSMDLASIEAKANPSSLVSAISKEFPSFPQQWVDDRTRTLAVLYLLKEKQPDLVLVHLVDLDAEEHEQGPFTQNAKAILERTDKLLGNIRAHLPSGYDFALVSDHGFERVDKIANVAVALVKAGISGEVKSLGGIATTANPEAAAFLRRMAKDPNNGIGREIPHEELMRYAPQLSSAIAAFEPAPHVMFGTAVSGDYFTAPKEHGNHGFWPRRADYRSIFVLCGPGIRPGVDGEIEMTGIARRLAAVLGLDFPK
ncbi:MAG TPA: ectonucleotide pyrophosphatase/phosphodiesterase [Bryobacteraceae bacterium]